MGPEKENDTPSYEDDLMADAMKAFDEVEAKGAGEPAPEPAPRETEQQDEPAEKPANDVPRNPDGTFKAKEPDKNPDKTDTQQPAEADKSQQQQQVTPAADPDKKPDTQQAPVGGPPPSWGIKAKASWDELPEHVRAEIVKRETEVSQGFGALREFKEIKQYADAAAQQGTTVPRMLDHYTRTIQPLERLLRQDLGTGLAVVAQNAGLNQQQAAQLFGQLAQKFGGGQPALQSNGAGQPATNGGGNELEQMFRPLLSPLMTEVQQLRTEFGNRLAADRNAQMEAQARAVAEAEQAVRADPKNRWYAEVEGDMARLLQAGIVPKTGNHTQDIQAAYDMAVRMHPEIQEALIEQRLTAERAAQRKKEQEAAEKAKQASRSVSGNRMPGITVKTPERQSRGSYEDDLRADVEAAWNAHHA